MYLYSNVVGPAIIPDYVPGNCNFFLGGQHHILLSFIVQDYPRPIIIDEEMAKWVNNNEKAKMWFNENVKPGYNISFFPRLCFRVIYDIRDELAKVQLVSCDRYSDDYYHWPIPDEFYQGQIVDIDIPKNMIEINGYIQAKIIIDWVKSYYFDSPFCADKNIADLEPQENCSNIAKTTREYFSETIYSSDFDFYHSADFEEFSFWEFEKNDLNKPVIYIDDSVEINFGPIKTKRLEVGQALKLGGNIYHIRKFSPGIHINEESDTSHLDVDEIGAIYKSSYRENLQVELIDVNNQLTRNLDLLKLERLYSNVDKNLGIHVVYDPTGVILKYGILQRAIFSSNLSTTIDEDLGACLTTSGDILSLQNYNKIEKLEEFLKNFMGFDVLKKDVYLKDVFGVVKSNEFLKIATKDELSSEQIDTFNVDLDDELKFENDNYIFTISNFSLKLPVVFGNDIMYYTHPPVSCWCFEKKIETNNDLNPLVNTPQNSVNSADKLSLFTEVFVNTITGETFKKMSGNFIIWR